MENNGKKAKNQQQMKSLLILYSYHHHNTEKIAKVFAEVLNAQIKMPEQINPEELQDYDLMGFRIRDLQFNTPRINTGTCR